MKEHLLRLYQHANWANRRILDLLRNQSQVNECARKLFSHVLAAEQVWITRLRGQDSSTIPIWPDLTLSECASLAELNSSAYKRFVSDLTEETLSRVVVYKNSKGQEFHTPVRDILAHVSLHGAHHRGQIATVVSDAGEEPVNTDYITFVREVG